MVICQLVVIDKGVPIDIGLDFGEIVITMLFSRVRVFGSHSFPCQSLLPYLMIVYQMINTCIWLYIR